MARRLLVLSVALCLVAGCGGGGSKPAPASGGGGGALSQEQWASQANQICREGSQKINEQAQKVQREVEQAGSAEKQQKVVADVLEKTAREYDPYLKRLHGLRAPADLSAEWDRFLAGIDKAFNLIPDLADATRAGDRAKLQELTGQFTQIAGDTRPFAQKYKLDDCLPDNNAGG